jgi:hypothetical protein
MSDASDQEGAEGEDGQTGDEESATSEQVGEPAAEQERPAEQDRVCGNDPLQARLGKTEIALDRGECDVHDCDVEDDHELRRDDERQRAPTSMRFPRQVKIVASNN